MKNAETDALGMTGPVVPFLLTCYAMHRAGSRQASSNTQHADSAIDDLRLHDSRAMPQVDDDLQIKHLLSKGLHATGGWESILADLF